MYFVGLCIYTYVRLLIYIYVGVWVCAAATLLIYPKQECLGDSPRVPQVVEAQPHAALPEDVLDLGD